MRGAPNRDLLDVILANCRIPEQNWGDLQALVAGLVTGERRVHSLITRFGVDTVLKGMDDLIDYTARKVEALIRRMPRGRYEFCDFIEDDVVSDIPIRLKVAMTVGDGEIHLDFTGSDVQVGSALNVPTGGRAHPFMAIALFNYFITKDPGIPLNAGVLRPIRMTLPVGSVVNPQFPAACGVRYATVLRVYDAVLGALARALPHEIPAAAATPRSASSRPPRRRPSRSRCPPSSSGASISSPTRPDPGAGAAGMRCGSTCRCSGPRDRSRRAGWSGFASPPGAWPAAAPG